MAKLSIFVTTGTSHFNFDRMLRLVEGFLNVIPGELEVLLQYGNSNPKELPSLIKSAEFLSRDDAEQAYKNSDIVFSHCGIGSIFNSLRYNRPTVIIPRYERYGEFTDDHQLQIAAEISSNDLIFMSEDTDDQEKQIDMFKVFLDGVLPKKKVEIDLTNYELANYIKTRLYFNGK